MSVYPHEVEKIIKSNPKVEECAVVGMPNLMTEEAVDIFIVIKSNRTLNMENLWTIAVRIWHCIRHLRLYCLLIIFQKTFSGRF